MKPRVIILKMVLVVNMHVMVNMYNGSYGDTLDRHILNEPAK
jgi:hypothetical protein